MDDDNDNGRKFSLIKAPYSSLPDLSDYDHAGAIVKNDVEPYDAVDEAVYENIPLRRNSEVYSTDTAYRQSMQSEPDNTNTDRGTVDLDSITPDLINCSIPVRAFRRFGSLGRRDSVDTVASSDNEAKREQRAAYRQELRRSSMIHVSDNNSIPVLEGLRKWASYRRISKEKAEGNFENIQEKIYDTPNGNLNPYLTHRRAPRSSSPQIPEQWKDSKDHRQTIVSPLESFNWDDTDAPDQRVPPKKPPPRPAIRKHKKPTPIPAIRNHKESTSTSKSPISILKNDLKSDNVPENQEEPGWFKKRVGRLKGSNDNSETPVNEGSGVGNKERKPFFYCKLISSYPKTAFGRFMVLNTLFARGFPRILH